MQACVNPLASIYIMFVYFAYFITMLLYAFLCRRFHQPIHRSTADTEAQSYFRCAKALRLQLADLLRHSASPRNSTPSLSSREGDCA